VRETRGVETRGDEELGDQDEVVHEQTIGRWSETLNPLTSLKREEEEGEEEVSTDEYVEEYLIDHNQSPWGREACMYVSIYARCAC
jgi:hypothetical protein